MFPHLIFNQLKYEEQMDQLSGIHILEISSAKAFCLPPRKLLPPRRHAPRGSVEEPQQPISRNVALVVADNFLILLTVL